MYQLRNTINRTVVPHDPEKNMHAAEDFMLLLLHAYVTYAGKLQQASQHRQLAELAKGIMDTYISIPNMSDKRSPDSTDTVYLYATEIITLGLLWHGFHDAIKEGDGDRILRYWKFLLVAFKATGHRNYAKEAVNLLYQYYYVFPERKKQQLLWSRCVNTRGCAGANIPCDLHMEHLNRQLKSIIRGMGGNVTPARIQKAAKSIAVVHRVCAVFELETVGHRHSDRHPYPTFEKDMAVIVKILEEEKMLVKKPARQYPFYKSKKSVLHTFTRPALLQRIQQSLDQIVSS